MFLLFRKRSVIVAPQYVSRTEFDQLKKEFGFLRTDFDNQDFS